MNPGSIGTKIRAARLANAAFARAQRGKVHSRKARKHYNKAFGVCERFNLKVVDLNTLPEPPQFREPDYAEQITD